MNRAVSLCLLAVAQLCAQRATPDYTQSSIVHAATGLAGALAPNTIATIYGVNLSDSTRALQATDIFGGSMPITLPGTDCNILVGGINVPIYFASPGQINFLVPAELLPGRVRLTVNLSGISGRAADVQIAATAPGLFLATPKTPAAVDDKGRAITLASPAIAGQWVVLYATGLGQTLPPVISGEIALRAAPLARTLHVWLNGKAITPAYAGLAPGYAGLYQINLQIPADTPVNPEVRLEVDGTLSPPGILLPLGKPN